MRPPGARTLPFLFTLLAGTGCAWLLLAVRSEHGAPPPASGAALAPSARPEADVASVAEPLQPPSDAPGTPARAADGRRELQVPVDHAPADETREPRDPLPPTPRLRGRVCETDGGPVAGALVELWGSGAGAGEQDVAPPRATTDDEGRFALPAPPGEAPGESKSELCVLAPDGRRVVRPLATTEEGHTLEIRLEAGRACAVRFFDGESEHPLADVPARLHGLLERRTDEAGRLAWTLPRDGARTLELVLEQATLRLDAGVLGTPERPSLVRVPAETRLEGRVLARDGTPLEGASLWALASSHSEDPEAAHASVECEARATSDASGHFLLRLRAASSARLRLVVERSGMLPYLAQDTVPLPCRDPLELRLRPAATIDGRLVGPQPRPVALEWEGPLGHGPGQAGRVRPEADGSFRIEGLEPGEHRLFAAWGGATSAREELARVVLAEGERRVLTLACGAPRVATIGGFVELADGSPAAGAEVRAGAWGLAGEPLTSVARTDDEGCFALAVAPDPGLAFDLEARLGSATARAREVAGGTRGLALRLSEPPRLRLAVRDAATLGALEGGVELAWRAAARGPFLPLHGDPRRRFGLDGRVDEPLDVLPAELRVEAPGHRPVVLAGQRLAAAIDPERPLELVLEHGASLRLRFTLEQVGAPPRLPLALRTGRVRLVPEGSAPSAGRALRADPEGSAQVDGLAPGRYRLVAEGTLLRFSPERIAVGSDGPSEATVAVLVGGP